MIKRLARWILRKEIEHQLMMSVPVGTALMIDDKFVGILTKDAIISPAPSGTIKVVDFGNMKKSGYFVTVIDSEGNIQIAIRDD